MASRQPMNKRALIVGGSMSGLFAALMLRRAGWDVTVVERVKTELSGRGAGIVAQPELLAHLQRLGLKADDLGVHIHDRKILGPAGQITERYECDQIATAWERLFRMLREALPAECYRRDCALAGFAQNDDGVVATFSGGETVAADLLIGADGIRSTVRQEVMPDAAPRYAGYVAWRSLIAEDALPPDVQRDIFPQMAFGLPRGEQFLSYPVAGPDNDLRPGRRRMNVIWYRPAEENTKLQWLLTDDSGKTHEISIPPPLIRRAAIEEMHDAAERLLAPQFRAVVRLMDEPILQPIYDLESPTMAAGRVAVIGDAAFVARPHVGAGVTKAADDAAALTAALAAEGDVAAALRRFEAQRLPVNRRIIEYARHLGSYLQATQTEAERDAAGRHSTDRAVIVETAVLTFL
ncbi:MAG: FAD-dependent monooxygenase [Pseudolabrys sp.]|nr:FAD-dependent monooxygenase [Pseudolabrys sp.]